MRHRAAERGQGLIEFAMLLPMLIVIVLALTKRI